MGVDPANLSPREFSDALWLALHQPRGDTPVAPRWSQNSPQSETARAVDERTDAFGEDDTAPSSADGRHAVYPLSPHRGGVTPGTPVRIPGVRGLPHPLAIARGLKALKRRVPSLHQYELDEIATAEAIADAGVLDAVIRPVRDRWLHLVLVVDDGPSMSLWDDTISELADVLTGSGIFRSVRVRPLAAPASDAADRTVVLLVTDGIARHWHTGWAHYRMAALARRAPTAVVHLFPTRLWSSTALAAEPMTVRANGPASPNTLLSTHHPWLPASLGSRPALPVPVLELAEWGLRPWAEMVASPGGTATLRVIDAARPAHPDPSTGATESTATEDDPAAPGTAAQRIQAFRTTASPEAYELAGHLAAVDPLTLPVMRVVQAAALPDSNRACLAEVLLSGLMNMDDSLDGHDVFSFAPDIRALLRTVIRAGAARSTVDAVSDFIRPRLDRSPDFPAVIADRTGTLTLPENGEPFAELPRPQTPEPLREPVFGDPSATVRGPVDRRGWKPRLEPARVHALIVGIETYGVGTSWDLPGPARDAVRFHQLLRESGVPEANLRLHLAPLAPYAPEIPYAPADHGALRRTMVQDLPVTSGDILWVWWGGHGVLDSSGQLQLFTADATSTDKLCIDLDSALTTYASDAVPGFAEQLWVVDASSNFEESYPSWEPLPRYSLPVGRPDPTTHQAVLRAASPGQVAARDPAHGTGLFSDVLLGLLTDRAAVLPALPDPEELFSAVRAHFAALQETGRTVQRPELRFQSQGGTVLFSPRSDPADEARSASPYSRLDRIVEALLAYPLMSDPAERHTVVASLDPGITGTLPRHAKARTDITGIVTSLARRHAQALQELFDAVAAVDDDPERGQELASALREFVAQVPRAPDRNR
ncbi:SAV_2336 N-terminal domain-related protein [Streptomyces sp. NPDC046862]|uniref:SAV_2336 N-terminal domain-related protein n=1 Tax=Streptomyces sp. NPDC046862 TaxID=3154603 RepID=UPI003453FFC9